MLPECPEELKAILPYLQRASELKGREPLIAYYCELYAANTALARGFSKTPENNQYLSMICDDLEEQKRQIGDDPAMNDEQIAKSTLLQFAMKIFLAADNEDRAGQATKKTGRLFLVASQFLEVTRVFGAVSEEIEERIKYAKWKAADIIRALNEGRTPISGPPGSSQDSVSSPVSNQGERKSSLVSPTNLPSLGGQFPSPYSPVVSPSNVPTLPPISQITNNLSPVVAPIATTPPSKPSSIEPAPLLDSTSLSSAEKYARFAVSAIQFEDIPTAIKNLEQSLQILRCINPQ